MVVGMQFLATDDQAPGQDITRGIGGLVIAITPIVTDTIDHTGRPERDPHHLHRPQDQAGGTEQRYIEHRHQRDAKKRKARVYVPLEPVIRCQVTIAIEGFPLGRLVPVELAALPQYLADTQDLGAMRIIRRLALCMVLAVYRHPLARHHAGSQPQPETEEVCHDGVQIQGTVGLVPVQINGNAGDCHLGQYQAGDNQCTDRELCKTTSGEEVEDCI